MEDELLAEEMQAQVAAAKQIVFQVINTNKFVSESVRRHLLRRARCHGRERLQAGRCFDHRPPPLPFIPHPSNYAAQLEAEIRETMDSLELQTAAAEARRLRADRGTAKLQREQVCRVVGMGMGMGPI